MTTNNLKKCAFCEGEINQNNKSKEHVIPQWLLDFLDIRDTKIQPTHLSSEGTLTSTRNQTLGGLVAGNICQNCNNGWMSTIEQQAIPILKPLIIGERAVVELNDTERTIIGRWTAKTAYCLNISSNYNKNVPKEHLNFIKKNSDQLPYKVATFAQQNHGTRKFYWLQFPIWVLHGNDKNLSSLGDELKKTSYKITFQFGKLMLIIIFLPKDNIYPVLWKGIHIPLIPKKGKCGWYEKEGFEWNDSEKSLNEFTFGLQATLL